MLYIDVTGVMAVQSRECGQSEDDRPTNREPGKTFHNTGGGGASSRRVTTPLMPLRPRASCAIDDSQFRSAGETMGTCDVRFRSVHIDDASVAAMPKVQQP